MKMNYASKGLDIIVILKQIKYDVWINCGTSNMFQIALLIVLFQLFFPYT